MKEEKKRKKLYKLIQFETRVCVCWWIGPQHSNAGMYWDLLELEVSTK